MHEPWDPLNKRIFIFIILVPLFIKIILNGKNYKNFKFFYNSCNQI